MLLKSPLTHIHYFPEEIKMEERKASTHSTKKQVPCYLRYRCCRDTAQEPLVFKAVIHDDFDGY